MDGRTMAAGMSEAKLWKTVSAIALVYVYVLGRFPINLNNNKIEIN